MIKAIILISRERTSELAYTYINRSTETQLVVPLLRLQGENTLRNHLI